MGRGRRAGPHGRVGVRTYGLIDGNSFYRSCERAFQPRLRRTGVMTIYCQNDID